MRVAAHLDRCRNHASVIILEYDHCLVLVQYWFGSFFYRHLISADHIRGRMQMDDPIVPSVESEVWTLFVEEYCWVQQVSHTCGALAL